MTDDDSALHIDDCSAVENGSETNSFFSSLELQSKFTISSKFDECISRSSTDNDCLNDAIYQSYFAVDNCSHPPQSFTGGKWKPGARPIFNPAIRFNDTSLKGPLRRSKRATWKGLPSGLSSHKNVAKNPLLSKNECDFVCTYCTPEVSFSLRENLVKHCNSNHADLLPVCSKCAYKYVDNIDFKSHSCKKRSKGEKSKKVLAEACSQCDYSTSKRVDLLLHLLKHQSSVRVTDEFTGKVVEKFKCPVCSKLLQLSSMRQHIYKHTGDKHYECTICSRQFIQRGSLWLHMQKHCNDRFSCEKCSYKSESKTLFEKHVKTHDDRKRHFVCNVCGAEHLCRISLKRHMQTHLKIKDRPLKCPEKDCKKAFISKTDFEYHLRVHRNECPYHCDVCDYKGKTSHQLKKHKRMHTGEKPFKCPQCAYTTAYSTHLTRHLLVHSGEKPYTCPYCDFKCNTIENIRKHILSTKKHLGKRVYPCKDCQESFNECTEFKAHLLSMHKDKYPGEEINIASVIAGLYKKVSQAGSDDQIPISEQPNVDLNNCNVKKINGKLKSKKSGKKPSAVFSEPNNIDSVMPVSHDTCDFGVTVPDIVDVSNKHCVVASVPCLSSTEVSAAECDKDKIDDSTNSLVSVKVDNQQIHDNETLNFFIESLNADGVSADQVELMQMVSFNIPEISPNNHVTLSDTDSIFIYV